MKKYIMLGAVALAILALYFGRFCNVYFIAALKSGLLK
jgi:hypothetical protein